MRTSNTLVKELLQTGKKTVDEDLTEDSLTAQTVSWLIEDAIADGASGVHIEPREDHVLIRYRVGDILKEATRLPRGTLSALVSRIKIMSDLKLDDRLAPQDGRFKISINDQDATLSVSILPIVDGEKVVMRILNESSTPPTLEELGYWGHGLDILTKSLTQPHGMILVTGPTGSGKSTTLFSLLSMLSSPKVNIATVEDPVDYQVPKTNQTQVNPLTGMTFANGLRAILRQSPDIIMISDMHDSETAGLAIQAATSGRLVLSALHTNNASACLPRLRDMGIEPFLIANTTRVIIGQRLVRRLCEDCREAVVPDASTLRKISKALLFDEPINMKRIHELETQALASGVGKTDVSSNKSSSTVKLSSSETKILRIWKAHGGGCRSCNQTGYKGRLGIYEALANSSGIQKLIVGHSTSEVIQDQAIKEGMVTMQLDGLIKALRGQTSIEEVLRATTKK